MRAVARAQGALLPNQTAVLFPRLVRLPLQFVLLPERSAQLFKDLRFERAAHTFSLYFYFYFNELAPY